MRILRSKINVYGFLQNIYGTEIHRLNIANDAKIISE